ncbi:carboxypeptidase regulatory-like domain-containing protein, partial [Candidatus Aerophobetes bacterium]|nr:carboxypeptidase regulatory-like domain-containing protein [Candidatus Aerophobetes bacterium]
YIPVSEYEEKIAKIEKTITKILDLLANFLNKVSFFVHYLSVIFHSPGEIRVYDSQSNITGLVNGEIREEIPNSLYDNEEKTIVIFSPSDSYRYDILGKSEGKYGLEVTSGKEAKITTFTAADIPVSSNTVHQYTIDWNALSQGKKGTTVQMDNDGDGTFEKTANTGATFQPPLVKINSPPDDSAISDTVAIEGTAWSEILTRYKVEYGEGTEPLSWATIKTSTIPVSNDTLATWDTTSLDDGIYTLRVYAEDQAGLTSTHTVKVKVDNTSPQATITFPSSGDAISGVTTIIGTVSDKNFSCYTVKYMEATSPARWITIAVSTTPCSSNTLATWNTTSTDNGNYILKLFVEDKAGNNSEDTIKLNVDNTSYHIQAIQDAYQAIEKAFEIEDITSLMSYFSFNFLHNGGQHKDYWQTEFENIFSNYQNIQVEFTNLRISINEEGNQATTSLHVKITAEPEGGGETTTLMDKDLSDDWLNYWIREDGSWRLCGNQQRVAVDVDTLYFEGSGYKLIIRASALPGDISSISISGPSYIDTADIVGGGDPHYLYNDGNHCDAGANDGLWGSWLNIDTTPTVGDIITFHITYTDSTTETKQKAIDGVFTKAVSIVSPPDGSYVFSTTPTFKWQSLSKSGLSYGLEIDDKNHNRIYSIYNLPDGTTSHTIPGGYLNNGETYYWDVTVSDGNGNGAISKSYLFTVSLPSTGISGTVSSETGEKDAWIFIQPQGGKISVEKPAIAEVQVKVGTTYTLALSQGTYDVYVVTGDISDQGVFSDIVIRGARKDVVVNQGKITSGINFTLYEGGILQGTVTGSAKGTALPGASVLVYTKSSSFLQAFAFTDKNGDYSLLHIPKGTYTIVVQAPGCKPKSSYVNIKIGKTTTKNFILSQKRTVPSVASITVDGDPNDWKGINPVVSDPQGDSSGKKSGTDVKAIYVAKDDTYLYFMMSLWDGPTNSDKVEYRYKFDIDKNGIFNEKDIEIAASPNPSLPWHLFAWDCSSQHNHIESIENNGLVGCGSVCEIAIPLSSLNNVSSFYITSLIAVVDPESGEYAEQDKADIIPLLLGKKVLKAYAKTIPARVKDYIVAATKETDTKIKITTKGKVKITVAKYADNPHPEKPLPNNAASLNKYIDIYVSDPDAVDWPLYVELYYKDSDVPPEVKESTLGLYTWRNDTWKRCRDTGVDTQTNIVWANIYQDELPGSPIGMGGSKDTTPPPAPVISSSTHPDENKWYNNNDPVFTWTEPQDPSGIAGYSYSLNKTPTSTPNTTVDTTARTISYTNIQDGSWYFHVRAEDSAGNWGPANHYTVRIDTTLPTTDISSPTIDTFVKGLVTIKGTAYDKNLDHYTLEYGEGTSPSGWIAISTSTNPVSNGILATWDTAGIDDGVYTLRVWVEDKAGNTSEHTVEVNVDNTLPTAEISYPSKGDILSKATVIVGTAWDKNFDQYILEYGEGTSPVSWNSIVISANSVKKEVLASWDITSLKDGMYVLRLKVFDKAKNTKEDQINLAVDNIYPETHLTDYPPSQVVGNVPKVDVNFSWIGSDNLTETNNLVYQWKMEGYKDDSWSDWSFNTSISYKLSSGNYTFKVRAKDEGGNYPDEDNSATAKYSFTILLPIIVYPNPCYLNKGQIVTIANLPLNSKVYIYTISGELVRTLDDATEIIKEGGSATATWDLRNDAGEEVAQGIYIYLVPEATGGKKGGKIIVIK